ncbi:hypothetical protein M9H77_14243 [Catharanthus roseus]|uniref:Uncharacterized protein n=1 Tax=Catharanthus roseus TaxID=4058 RepID=A0ACC0BMH0_CATRO|nr:hypothetical protein M9H77_14243 [Catharanthus roseus]
MMPSIDADAEISPESLKDEIPEKKESLKDEKEIKRAKDAEEEKQGKNEEKEKSEEEEEEEEDDTMEGTWRAINGEISKPENKQLKKSETWPHQKQRNWDKRELKKSMTFNDSISIRCRGGLMRDPSMSIEEFNGKVEDFIKKFNNEMRLQRQESEQRYLEMINRSL